jgi:biopolymer transport protein ExbB
MKTKGWVMKKSLFMVALVLLAGSVLAQAGTDTAAVAAAAAKKQTLWDLIKVGGWCMWPLGGLSFVGVVLVVQNFISLRERRLLHTEMIPDLIDMMIKKKVRAALIYCRKNPSMFTNTFGAGLERVVDGVEDFDKVVQSAKEASIEQMTVLMKPIDMLSIVGTTSPMVGLLGTVSGMIKAFQTMGIQGMGKPELLAANIGEALITTAAGLIIAIPIMFFYFYFKKRFGKTMATLGRNLSYLYDALESGKLPASFVTVEELEKMSGE